MKFKCDLHVHSILSGCASRDNSILNIINMAHICEIEVLAIADHNSGLNACAAFEYAKKNNILLIPALEATTAEDIHVLCYFRSMKCLRSFSYFLAENMMKFPLDKRLYYPQTVETVNGIAAGGIDYLLNTATDLNIYRLVEEVRKREGVCVPAHADKNANGIINILGEIPSDLGFSAAEITNNCPEALKNELGKKFFLFNNSDSHCLEDIAANESFISLKSKTVESFFDVLFNG